MKKHIAILLSILLILSLIGCGTNQPVTETDNYDKNKATQTPTAETVVSEATPESATSPTASKDTISKDEAIDIALKKAELSKEDLLSLHAELDYDDGVLVYEVDFSNGKYDYDCDINAKTGKILHFDKELDD